MNRRIPIAVSFALLFALPAWSQDEHIQEDKPESAGEEKTPPPVELGGSESVDFSWWVSDFDLAYQTATGRFEYVDPSLEGVEISQRLDLSEDWSVRAGLEAASGLEKNVLGVSLSAIYRPRLLPKPFDLSMRAGVVLARMEMNNALGDFDPAIGAEASLRAGYLLTPISENLDVHVELGVRYMEFDFVPDAGVIAADDTVGGLGGRLLTGVSVSF